ncbi:MAG TPA: adenylate/guanylate cyclase domain-containing protein [Burkholderiales bacterium]|nr:adenylate/guanylate cyclase domain-containing protein [Burkholderiales bacterium]
MEDSRQTTVLFADVSGSTKLYETAGDSAAMQAIGRCIEQMRKAAESTGGRVVKTIGDEVMVLFPSADAAAGAASEMHATIEQLPEVGGTKLGVRIGFHSGPVIQLDDDVFGDTVNLAARLVEQAGKGQIIISHETAELLSPAFKMFTRPLYSIQVKGKADEVGLCEVMWRPVEDRTTVAGYRPKARPAASVLRLKYRDQELTRRRDNDSVTLGREQGCGLVVADQKASRQHCTIERRLDKWVLRDHSTNGTYVTIEGDSEVLLQREDLTLRRHGWIAFGQSRTAAAEVVEYFCE